MRKKWLLLIPVVLVILYLLGPTPARPSYPKDMPAVPSDAANLEKYVSEREAVHTLKKDNEARIVWVNDSLRQPTEYAIVYLHGFSSSQGEGDPVHRDIARQFGCNLYLSRLAEHGIDTVDQLINLTADAYWESAKQALAIGRRLGKKLILMGCSTGGTQALQLAATYPDSVDALVLLSPNIAINDPNAWLLNNHWGLQIAGKVVGSRYIDSKDERPQYRLYWYWHYRLEGAAALQEMLETTMNKATFEKVRQPTEVLYYYRDSIHQDSTVKVAATLKMFDELGTPAALKYKQAMPNTGNHVIGSSLRSGDVAGVEREIRHFLADVLHIPPAEAK